MIETSTATVKRPMIKIDLKSGKKEKISDLVVFDQPFKIYLNDAQVGKMFALPTKLKELALGYLLDEGILNAKEEIEKIWVKGLDIEVKTKKKGVKPRNSLHNFSKSYIQLLPGINHIDDKITLTYKRVLRAVLKLIKISTTYKATGGTHSAAIFLINGKLVSFAEDVGRHNSVDKVIGGSILSGVNLSQAFLVNTARQSASMVLKAARVGIPIVVSKAGPTLSGIDVAEKIGITLICFVRETRMNIYTHPERVI